MVRTPPLLRLGFAIVQVAFASVSGAAAQNAAPEDSLLESGFQTPLAAARPRVWWQWMNGNITKEGIRLDLEWMKRIGIGGVQNFDAGYSTPQVVDKRLVFMTPAWNDAFQYTATFASDLGLELAIAGSPGWSESGGPWVKPEDGMKKLVWSETFIPGGVSFIGRLVHPPTAVGPFQNLPMDRAEMRNTPAHDAIPDIYQDVAVIAYKLPDSEHSMAELQPKITSSAGAVDGARLTSGDFTHPIHLAYGSPAHPAWIQVDFGHARTMQSMTLGLLLDYSDLLSARHCGAKLEASVDGVAFHTVAAAYDSADQSFASTPPIQQTVTFAPTYARYYRLLLPPPPRIRLSLAEAQMWGLGPLPKEHQVAQFALYTTPRVDHFEEKAGFFLGAGINSHPTRRALSREILRKQDIVDLTSQFKRDGTLNWTPPAGRWVILRFGYSLLGVKNHPASPEGTGLEVDKLSSAAVKTYIDQYLGAYESILGPGTLSSHGLRAMVNDSWEAGPQNWTPDLGTEFARRRGYDLRLWLPALTGRIIDSAQSTDQFLWDFRRTLGELLAEHHYGQIAASLHARGMIHYGESHEDHRAFIGDGMDVKRDDDIPMSAMWMPRITLFDQANYDADIRESASVSHIYGQNIVAAESMTALGTDGAAFAFAPENLKPTADRELADGLNLFVIHTSVHQPLSTSGPGVTLGPYGQWFTRQETWAEQAAPWVNYLSRSSFLLQQGHFVADILFYYGQDSNITALYGQHLPSIPEGYAFDFANAHALTMLKVEGGYLTTASGMHYRLLALDPRARVMSLDVLQRIALLVNAGAIVVGDKPQATPSLNDNEEEFRTLADAVWGNGPPGEHRYGEGRTLSGTSLVRVVDALKLPPDFTYSRGQPHTTVWFVHRHLADGDIYFVNNRRGRAERIEARFRVTGKAAEIWHADTGGMEPASYRIERNSTFVPLNLDPQEAVFVVFRNPAKEKVRRVPAPVRHELGSVAGPWTLRFQSGRGAPDRATFPGLKSWTVDRDPNIKYFSGTAEYAATLRAPSWWWVKGQRLELDLGDVRNLAEVVVNGQSAGIVWKSPFRADITDFLQPGVNQLTIRVTNLWANRLIGDKQPHAKPIAFTTFNPYSATSSLLESGLLGPVTVVGKK
jgi:hypothetical protein